MYIHILWLTPSQWWQISPSQVGAKSGKLARSRIEEVAVVVQHIICFTSKFCDRETALSWSGNEKKKFAPKETEVDSFVSLLLLFLSGTKRFGAKNTIFRCYPFARWNQNWKRLSREKWKIDQKSFLRWSFLQKKLGVT